MIVAGTGHRPNKLGGYSTQAFEKLAFIISKWLEENNPSEVISGMALGYDQALAVAAIRLNIPVAAYIPCLNHSSKWPQASQKLYARILAKCSRQVMVTDVQYSKSCMQARNERMVDDSDLILAMWDGTSGGTGNCIRYANKKGKKISNLYDIFLKNEFI